MILKTLHLINFRKFKDTTIEFPDGVTSIIGYNGAGKSTIFEAIAWTIYGSVASRTPAEQIKRINTKSKEPCRVELEFVFNEDTYRIIREMHGKNQIASATITINKKLAVNGAEPTTKYIQKKLGLDFKSFFTSIFARQKELNALSTMNTSERRPLILKMLGVDSLDEILTNIRSDRREKKNLVEKLQEQLIDNQGNEKTKQIDTEIKKLKEKNIQIHKLKEKNKLKIQQIKNTIKNTDKKHKETKQKYEQLRKQKENYAEKKTNQDKKIQLHKEIEKLTEEINKRKQEIQNHNKKLKKTNYKNQDIKDNEEEQKQIQQNLNALLIKIENKKTQIQQQKNEIEELIVKKTNIQKMGPSSKCPTCEKQLGEQHNILINKFIKMIKEKNQNNKTQQNKIKEEQTKYEQITRQKQALQKKYNYIQNMFTEQEKITTIITSINKELLKEESEKKHKERQLKEVKNIEFNEKQYQKLKNQVNQTYELLQYIIEELKEKRKECSDYQILQEKQQGEEKLIHQQTKIFEEKIKQLKEFEKQIQREQIIVKNLSILQEIMSSFRTYLISRIRPTLSSYASALFEQLTNGKYHEIELDENYNLTLYENGESYKIERFSGGEEDLANLCLRLAISEVITERAGSIFHVLVLDEIFGSQDSVRRQNIIHALNNLSFKFRQIFLITHIEEIKNYMENTITVIEDENGISSIKIE